jgi:hypothetical protein
MADSVIKPLFAGYYPYPVEHCKTSVVLNCTSAAFNALRLLEILANLLLS